MTKRDMQASEYASEQLRNGAVERCETVCLTDEERLTLRGVRDTYADEDDIKCNEIAAVIDGILERMVCGR